MFDQEKGERPRQIDVFSTNASYTAPSFFGHGFVVS